MELVESVLTPLQKNRIEFIILAQVYYVKLILKLAIHN